MFNVIYIFVIVILGFVSLIWSVMVVKLAVTFCLINNWKYTIHYMYIVQGGQKKI